MLSANVLLPPGPCTSTPTRRTKAACPCRHELVQPLQAPQAAVQQPVCRPVNHVWSQHSSISACRHQQQARQSVIAQSKRGRPKSKSVEAPAAEPAEEEPAPSGWDAALAGIPSLQAGSELVVDDDELIEGDEEDLLGAEDDEDGLLTPEDEGEYETDPDDDMVEAYAGEDEELMGDEGEFEDMDELIEEVAAAVDEEQRSQHVPIETVSYDQAWKAASGTRTALERPTVIEIVEETDAVAEAERAARERALAIPEGAQLTLDRQGFQAFIMDPIEFLVAETTDGKLNLADSYVYDPVIKAYMRPTTNGTLPKGPAVLQVIPWVERRSADSLKNKEAIAKMKKVYFVGVASQIPYRMALDQAYCFDAGSRTLSQLTVKVDPAAEDPVLRIRADGLYVEDSERAPPPWAVAEGMYNVESEEEKERRLQERIEELEAQAEELDELDEAPDVSAADMM